MDYDKLTKKVTDLEKEITLLKQEIARNNFSAHQDFNKASNFTSRLKVPHYDTVPAIGVQGEICEVSGRLYIFESTNICVPV